MAHPTSNNINRHDTSIKHTKIVMGNLNTSLSQMDRAITKKSIKMSQLNQSFRQIHLINIYKVFYTKTEQIFYSASDRTFFKIDRKYITQCSIKKHLRKFKRIKIILYTLSYHSAIKLEINNRRNYVNYADKWQLNNTFLNNQWVIGNFEKYIREL